MNVLNWNLAKKTNLIVDIFVKKKNLTLYFQPPKVEDTDPIVLVIWVF